MDIFLTWKSWHTPHFELPSKQSTSHIAKMPAPSWATPEQQTWLNEYQQKHYLPLMAKRNYTGFWNPFYEAFGVNWPECERLFPGIDEDKLTSAQRDSLANAIKERKSVSKLP